MRKYEDGTVTAFVNRFKPREIEGTTLTPLYASPAQSQPDTANREERFCYWLKGYLGAIKGRDELDASEANKIRNELNETLDSAPIASTDGERV
jgi:hypothetical protein